MMLSCLKKRLKILVSFDFVQLSIVWLIMVSYFIKYHLLTNTISSILFFLFNYIFHTLKSCTLVTEIILDRSTSCVLTLVQFEITKSLNILLKQHPHDSLTCTRMPKALPIYGSIILIYTIYSVFFY